MEKKSGEKLTFKEGFQLSSHILICKWCRAYNEKLKKLDSLMKKISDKEKKSEFNHSDIQSFKDDLIKKIK